MSPLERPASPESNVPCLRLKSSVSVTPTGVGVILRTDLGAFEVTGSDAGAFLEQVVPLLDGSRDREAIFEALPGYSRKSVTALLDRLTWQGLIEAAPDAGASGARGRWRGQEEFFGRWSRAPEEVMRRLFEARVILWGLGPWIATVATELMAAGVGVLHRVSAGAAGAEGALLAKLAMEPWSLLVAAVAPPEAEQLERVSRFADRAKVVSLWSHLTGTSAFLGPLVIPGETACRVCAAAEGLNPPIPARSGGAPPHRAEAMQELLGHRVALEALKVLSGYTRSMLGGQLLIQDLSTLETSLHTLVRLPWCRVCGSGAVT